MALALGAPQGTTTNNHGVGLAFPAQQNTMSKTTSKEYIKAPRSKDMAGCCLVTEYSTIKPKRNLGAIVSHFQRACESADFVSLCTNAGFSNASFHVNNQLQPGNPGHDKFVGALEELDRNVCLGIAFHGTAPANMRAILRDGLDPNKRRGQSYGPGEYFGKDPSVSVGYCRGGLEMLVFVVVLPSTLPDNPSDEASKVPDGCDFVVVNNNAHQLPIGSLKFTSVNQAVKQRSQEKRMRFLSLSREVFDKSRIAEEGIVKEKIMHDLVNNEVDIAAERYQKNSSFLKETSKKEIAWYVHKQLDEDVICAYFPDLPDPMEPGELEKANIPSNDDAIEDLCQAVEQLKHEQPGTWNFGFEGMLP